MVRPVAYQVLIVLLNLIVLAKEVIAYPVCLPANLAPKKSNANREIARTIFAASGDKFVVKTIPTATKTIIASKKHIIAGINGL